jgi:hypothetical protein
MALIYMCVESLKGWEKARNMGAGVIRAKERYIRIETHCKMRNYMPLNIQIMMIQNGEYL